MSGTGDRINAVVQVLALVLLAALLPGPVFAQQSDAGAPAVNEGGPVAPAAPIISNDVSEGLSEPGPAATDEGGPVAPKPNLIEKYVLAPINEDILRPIKEELLEIELPETQERYKVEVSVRPRIEDIVKSDYLRVPVRFKYGLTKNVDISVQPNTYLHNPVLRETAGIGLSTLDLGTKFRFQRILHDYLRMAFAFYTIYPVGHNPEFMDGYVHYKPSLLFSKDLPDFHNIELASSIGFDVIDGATEGLKEDGEMPLDVLTISFGGRKPVPPYSYSLEFVYTTDRQDGGESESLTMTPGMHWYVPPEKWQWLPGDAVLSAGVRFGIMDAKTYEIVFGFKVDIPIDIKLDIKKREMDVKSEGIKRSYRKIKGVVTGSRTPDETGGAAEAPAEPEPNAEKNTEPDAQTDAPAAEQTTEPAEPPADTTDTAPAQ